jgi:hypothetical protein
MALNIGVSNYGLGRQTVAELNKMSARVHNGLDATVPATVIPDRFTIDSVTSANIDKMCRAIATADGKSPNFVFGRHWSMNRSTVHALIQFEQRLSALGK